MNKVLAIILAGGNGSRMGTLTRDRAKPILPFAAGYRVIDFTLSNCLDACINDIFVLVDYQKEKTSLYLSKWALANGAEKKVRIIESRFQHYLGTADAVRQNLDYIKQLNPDVVLVLAADHVYRMNYRKMLDFHIKMKADITLAVKDVNWESATRFGVVTINNDHEIARFAEKPRFPESNHVSMGIYIINTNNLIELLEKRFNPAYTPLDFGNDIMPAILGQRRALAYKYDGYWKDIGTTEAYYEAHMDLLGKIPDFSLDGQSPVRSDDKQLSSHRIAYSGNVVNSIICPPCHVDGIVENSILSSGVHVKRNAIVRDSIILNNAVIGEYSVIDHCIIDQDAKVDRLSYVGKPGSLGKKFSITVIGKGARLSSYDALLLTYKNLLQTGENDLPVNISCYESSYAR
jgi:glucose-1-phosphate adenylyltransferase